MGKASEKAYAGWNLSYLWMGKTLVGKCKLGVVGIFLFFTIILKLLYNFPDSLLMYKNNNIL